MLVLSLCIVSVGGSSDFVESTNDKYSRVERGLLGAEMGR